MADACFPLLPAQKQIAHHVLAGRTLYRRDVAAFFQAATHHPVVWRVSRPLNGQTAAVTWAHLQDAVDMPRCWRKCTPSTKAVNWRCLCRLHPPGPSHERGCSSPS